MTLQERIDHALIEQAEKNSKRERSGKFGASSFGSCYRRQVLNRLNVPVSDPLEIKTLQMFEAGKIVHDFIQQYFKADQNEVKVGDDDFIGYADIVGDDIVYDIKSVNPSYFFFGYKDKKRTELNVPEINKIIESKKVNNIMQVTEYAIRLGKPRVGLVFFSRDLSYGIRAHEWTDLTENWSSLVLEEINNLLAHWDNNKKNGTLPDINPRLYDGKECSYCPYKTKCANEK